MKETGYRSDSSDIFCENDQSMDELEDEEVEEAAAEEEKHATRVADGTAKKQFFCPSKKYLKLNGVACNKRIRQVEHI